MHKRIQPYLSIYITPSLYTIGHAYAHISTPYSSSYTLAMHWVCFYMIKVRNT